MQWSVQDTQKYTYDSLSLYVYIKLSDKITDSEYQWFSVCVFVCMYRFTHVHTFEGYSMISFYINAYSQSFYLILIP